MATFRVNDGIDNFANKLEKLAGRTDLYGTILYEGAKVLADACKESIRALPVQEKNESGMKRTGITQVQKNDLEESFGIAPMQEKDGVYDIKAGFDGYGSQPTKKYPKGLPNAMLARSVESGTSFRQKYPFIRPAVKAAKQPVMDAMQKELDEQIQKLNQEGVL